MDRDSQLIKLYYTICLLYNNRLVLDLQRLSNNFRPKFTDEECMTIILWGVINRKFTVKDAWGFIKDFYADWFPDLPKYKAFNKRFCYLSDGFRVLCDILLNKISDSLALPITTHLIDSMPIIVAKEKRCKRAKVAKEICNMGYCDSKKMFYYGVKLTAIGQSQHKTLPTPRKMLLTPAASHDINMAKEMLQDVYGIGLYGDKAYINEKWQSYLLDQQDVKIFTPIKHEKGQKPLESADKLLSTAISRVRQPIESFFNWLQEKTNLEKASKVRSAAGLLSFVFSRIAACCLIMIGAF